jgi:hypothetical protein
MSIVPNESKTKEITCADIDNSIPKNKRIAVRSAPIPRKIKTNPVVSNSAANKKKPMASHKV